MNKGTVVQKNKTKQNETKHTLTERRHKEYQPEQGEK